MTQVKRKRKRNAGVAYGCWALQVGAVLVGLLGPTVYGQRNLKDIPVPDAELERKTFIVPEGFEVNLYASDPQIAKPIHMNKD